jgi:hypothetical protein
MSNIDRDLAVQPGDTLRRIARAGASLLGALMILLVTCATNGLHVDGTVLDAETRRPVAGAVITIAGTSKLTQKDGAFRIEAAGTQIGVRAHGYSRYQAMLSASHERPLEITLRPVLPRAVYLSPPALKDRLLRESILGLHGSTQVNAMVMDVKDDRGVLWLGASGFPMVGQAAEDLTESTELKALVERLHQDGMYAIARVAVFKDDVLGQANPEMALRNRDGSILRDNDGRGWTDPRNKTVWAYNIAVAVAAARNGFDEIQFDYVRFPSVNLGIQPTLSSADRREAIRGFLSQARAALLRYNVFVAANVFGYASWDPSDTNIGQNLEEIAKEVDYICLMLYPSAFAHGIPGSRMPLENPGRIVDLSLRKAQGRTGLPAIRFRPWLQAFRDDRFDGRPFARAQITAQTRIADQFGSDGWMLWNARSIYSVDALP